MIALDWPRIDSLGSSIQRRQSRIIRWPIRRGVGEFCLFRYCRDTAQMSPIIGIDIAGTNGNASMSRKTSAAPVPVVRALTVIAVLATGHAARTGIPENAAGISREPALGLARGENTTSGGGIYSPVFMVTCADIPPSIEIICPVM